MALNMSAWWLLIFAVVGINILEAAPLNQESNITVISEEYGDNDVEFSPGMFEGDIDMDGTGYNPRYRIAMRSRSNMWRGGVVPYRIHSSFSPDVAQMFRDSLAQMQNELRSGNRYCILFVERRTQTDYVYIQPNTGCSSKIGRFGGGQVLSLGDGCVYSGILKHEIMHALGFWHEQSRFDRDSYVTIEWDNIQSEELHNFVKHFWDGDTQGQPYDMLSIMHYEAFSFPIHKSIPTIVANQRGVIMGQRRGLSAGNVRDIQLKYDCPVDTSNVRSPALPRSGSIFDCNFESDMCGLSNEGDFNWEMRAGPTMTPGTGPTADHTSGNGTYLYAQASTNVGQTARFFYPGHLVAGRYCAMFQYWIYGSNDMQPLKIGADVNGRRVTLFTVRFRNHNYWRWSRLTLNVSQRWRLFFEVTPNTTRGDIAIDDMEVFPNSCPQYEK